MTRHFGKSGAYYHAAARGEDHRPVVSDQKRKSLGAETTFARDLLTWEEVPPVLTPLIAKVWAAYEKGGVLARTVTVKVKYADFQQVTRSRSVHEAIIARTIFEEMSVDLSRPLFPPRRGVRLLGVTLSNFDTQDDPARRQLALL